MYIIIVGGGNIGEYLVNLLIKEGHSIVVIEQDEEKARRLAENYDILVIHGDGSEVKYLEDANIRKADVLVAATGNDQINFVACQLAKSTYKVPKVIARTTNVANKIIYENLGVDVVVSTTEVAALALYSGVKGFSTVIPLGPDVGLIQFIVGKNSPVANRPLKDVHLPWGSTVVMIYRKGEVIIPRGDEVIHAGDTITVVAKKNVETKVREILVGK